MGLVLAVAVTLLLLGTVGGIAAISKFVALALGVTVLLAALRLKSGRHTRRP